MTERRIRVSIVGASGYVGGELLRLLLKHPLTTVAQATAESHVGRYVYQVHPNLRGHSRLRFEPLAQLEPCEVLFAALPHGQTSSLMDCLAQLSERVIDLSADFRLRDPELYRRYYAPNHSQPDWLEQFVYGLPEIKRAELRGARYVAGTGCLAATGLLGLYPLVAGGVVTSGPVIIEAKVGSSAAGASPNLSTHHPERSGVLRSFAPTAHRHTAELAEQLGLAAAVHGGQLRSRDIHFSATAVELVRGVLITAHCFPRSKTSERDLWQLYREYYAAEPFVRIVKERKGIYRYPEPKLLAGTNSCEVGFEVDPDTNRIVIMAALDNLMKGAAGNAVQAMNVMLGIEETTGLDFIGLHP